MATLMLQSPKYGKFYFDAVFKTEHNFNLSVTDNPVQEGASVSDHAYMEPDEIKLEIGFTDCNPQKKNAKTNYSVGVMQKLESIMRQRELLTLTTRLKQYSNVVLTAMAIPDDYTTMNAFKASLVFKEVRIVSAQTVSQKKGTDGSKKKKTGGGGTVYQTYKVQIPGMGEITVTAASVQDAITKAQGTSWTGSITVNGKNYEVVKGVIKTGSDTKVDEDSQKKQDDTRIGVDLQILGDDLAKQLKDAWSSIKGSWTGFFKN